MDNCSYSNCALAARVGYVIHHGWAYSHLARHRHYRYRFASHQWPESGLIVTELKGAFSQKIKSKRRLMDYGRRAQVNRVAI